MTGPFKYIQQEADMVLSERKEYEEAARRQRKNRIEVYGGDCPGRIVDGGLPKKEMQEN